MEKKEQLEKEIIELTNTLRSEKPAVYKHVMESPQTIPNEQDKESDDFLKALAEYKEQLEQLLNQDNK